MYISGSKSPAAVKEPVSRIQFLTNNVEAQIKQKLSKVSSCSKFLQQSRFKSVQFQWKVLTPVRKGSAIHVDGKLYMVKADGDVKSYGASFAGAYGTEGTKLAVNAQLELPINDEVSDPFTVLILNKHGEAS